MWVKYKMCYNDLNLVSSINGLIDEFSCFEFMDVYPGYNQIRMNSSKTPKTLFMTDHNNCYYEVLSISLKNIGVTYQRLMNVVFS